MIIARFLYQCLKGFSAQLKKINRVEFRIFQAFTRRVLRFSFFLQQFKKHFQHDVKPNSGFFLSRIKSQSLGALSSILDKKPMREKSSTRRQLKTFNKSAMSLNSLESNDEEEIRTESLPQNISVDSLVSFFYFMLEANSEQIFPFRKLKRAIRKTLTPKAKNRLRRNKKNRKLFSLKQPIN